MGDIDLARARATWTQKTLTRLKGAGLVSVLSLGLATHAEAQASSVVMEAGWNLIATPAARQRLHDWEALGLSIWWGQSPKDGTEILQPVQKALQLEAEALESCDIEDAPSCASIRREPEDGSAEEPSAGALWVFAPEAIELPAFAPVRASKAAAGWRFVSVRRETIFGDPNIERIERWDPSTQQYETVRLGERLVPMVGYRAYLREADVPLQNSCLGGTWTFEAARTLMETCPFSTSQRPKNGQDAVSAKGASTSARPFLPSHIIIHQESAESPVRGSSDQDKEPPGSRSDGNGSDGNGSDGNGSHFLITTTPSGTWEIEVGEPLTEALPPIVHIEVKTYDREGAAAAQSLAPPPQGAVIRLTELVANLSTGAEAIEGITADDRQASEPWRHLVDVLQRRFFEPGQTTPPPEPGAFEVPAGASPRGLFVALPKVALAAHTDRTWAHLVYVVRHHDGGAEELRYARSFKAAQAQSFQTAQTLARPGPGWTFTDLAMTARDNKVSIAWILSPLGEEKQNAKSQIRVALSHDHGQHFLEPETLRENHAWKRGLDLAYDRFGHHHIVWGEAHKAYYLKNLDGEPQNVFDRVRRDKNTRVVEYNRAYQDPQCRALNPCDCIEWQPEVYSYAIENDPSTGRPFGPFLDRIEEAWVYNPSLEIDENTLSIVVHQDRMWDNLPVPNPDWTGASETSSCPEEGDRIGRKGFQKVWVRRRGQPEPTPEGKKILPAKGRETVAKVEWAQGPAPASAPDAPHHQYLYDGTWHEQDQIRVAQRPLVAGDWSQPAKALREVPIWPITRGLLEWHKVETTVEEGFRQGIYRDGVRQDWRYSVVAHLENPLHEDRQAAPKLVATQDGSLIAVYSDGPSDNAYTPDQNPVFIQQSLDGGRTWAPRTLVTHGYLPDAAATADGELGLLVYQPAPQASGTNSAPKIQMFRSRDFNTWDQTTLNRSPPAPLHWNPHQSLAAGRIGVPAISSHQDLFVATWIQWGQGGQEGTRVVTSRAARVNQTRRYQIDHHGPLTVGKHAKFTVTAVNQYDMRVNDQNAVRIQNASGTPQPGAMSTPAAVVDARNPDDSDARVTLAPLPTIPLQNGQATLIWAPDGPNAALSVQSAEVLGSPFFTTSLAAYPQGEKGNYQRAVDARDRMRRTVVDAATGQAWVFQVEYASAEPPHTRSGQTPDAMQEGLQTDAQYLSDYERVWVYTQGIALAQLAKQHDAQAAADAQGIARYLCAKAKRTEVQGERIIRGWPFSWNTQGDNWEDRRLVTGANAWAIHGLGVFVASKAFEGLEAKEQDERLLCYEQAIRGLKEHRRRLIDPSTGNTVTLMTAGWTAQGLSVVEHPSEIIEEEDPRVRWGYYSVLDAIGYDDLPEDRPPEIQRLHTNAQGHLAELAPWVLTEPQHQILRRRVLANNVVTEHNLDVLSVLNHALKHQKEIGLTEVAELERWRNELREGIFSLLWDEKGWKADLEYTLQGEAIGEGRRAELEEALAQQDLGRIITGGQISTEKGAEVFEASPHVAIDNCSWLSLSVDYDRLAPASETVDRLAKCLLYTELQFVKPLRFYAKTYLGAHYFQNAFRDPYIEPSQLQESSFHLEATTGLILGLDRFANAYPEHPLSKRFAQKAQVLWDGVQAFVQDHGFRYSSQRIQDLSTLLSSSTAAIWFIDVYRERHRPSLANWMRQFPNAALVLYPLMAGLIPEGDAFGLQDHAWLNAISSLVATHTTVPLSNIQGWQTPWRVVHVLATEEDAANRHSVPLDFGDKTLGSAEHPFPSLASVIYPSIAGTSVVASISLFSPVVIQEPAHRMQLIRPRGMMADILLVRDLPEGSPSAPTRFELHPAHGGHFDVNVAPVLPGEQIFVACASDRALLSRGLNPSVDALAQLDGKLWIAPVQERTVSTRLKHEAGPDVLHGRFQAKDLKQTVWPFKPHDAFYQDLHCGAFKEAVVAGLRLVSLPSLLQTLSHGAEDLGLEVTALWKEAQIVARFTPPEGVDIIQEATLNLVKKDHAGNILDVMTQTASWQKPGEMTFLADDSLSTPNGDDLTTFLETVGEEVQLSAVLSLVGLDGNRVVAMPSEVDFTFEEDGTVPSLTEILLGFFHVDDRVATGPRGPILSYGLSSDGQAYVGIQDHGEPIWVNTNSLEHTQRARPETQNLVGSVSRHAKPGTILANVVKKGAASFDALAHPGAAGATQLMAAGTTLASLVAISTGQVETWTTLIHLNSAPNESTEPWTLVGHVPESEVTFSGFFFKDEGLIRRDVRISQSHVQGGFETSTLAFDDNAIYGLVKEVYGPEGGVLHDLYRIGLPTGQPVAVYRLDTDLAPEQIVEAVIDLQYPWLKPAPEGTDAQTFADELWNHVKDLALTPDFRNIDLAELIRSIETQGSIRPPQSAGDTPLSAPWLDQVPEEFRASVYYWTVLAPQVGVVPSPDRQPSLWDALQNDLERLDEHTCLTVGSAYASRFPGVRVDWVPESSRQPGRCIATTNGPSESPTPKNGSSEERETAGENTETPHADQAHPVPPDVTGRVGAGGNLADSGPQTGADAPQSPAPVLGAIPSDLPWKYAGHTDTEMTTEQAYQAMSTSTGFHKLFPGLVMLENLEALHRAGQFNRKTSLVFILNEKSARVGLVGRSFAVPAMNNFQYTRFELSPTSSEGQTRITMYHAGRFDGSPILDQFGLKDDAPSLLDEFVKTPFGSKPMRIAATPVSDRILFEAKTRTYRRPTVFLAYHPQKGYAAFAFTDEQAWASIKNWGPETVLVSYTGIANKNGQNFNMEAAFEKLPDLPYIRSAMPNGSVRYYNRELRWYSPPDEHWSSDPLAAYQKGIVETARAFSQTPAIASKPPLERFNAKGVYRHPVALTDDELKAVHKARFPEGIVLQLRSDDGPHNEPMYTVVNIYDEAIKGYLDFVPHIVGVSFRGEGEEERALVQQLWTYLIVEHDAPPFLRVVGETEVRYYNGMFEIVRETPLQSDPGTAYQTDVESLRMELAPEVQRTDWGIFGAKRVEDDPAFISILVDVPPEKVMETHMTNRFQERHFPDLRIFNSWEELSHWEKKGLTEGLKHIFVVAKRTESEILGYVLPWPQDYAPEGKRRGRYCAMRLEVAEVHPDWTRITWEIASNDGDDFREQEQADPDYDE